MRTIPREEYRDLVTGTAPIDLVLDLFGRPRQIHCGPPAAQRLGPDYAAVLGALALSDRPLRPENLPTVTANPSKVAERLRRKLYAPWIVTDGRGEGKTFEFAVPPGLSVVVIADSRTSIDFNALAWL